jgi:hypothetical protein
MQSAEPCPSNVLVAFRRASEDGKSGGASPFTRRAKSEPLVVPETAKRSASLYFRRLLLNPFNLYMALAVAAFGLITGHFLVLPVALVIELLVLAVVPRTRVFRRHVDEALKEMDRAAAAKARETLTVQMTDGHRQELDHLELLVDGIRENTRRHGGTVKLALDEHLGLGRLTTSYIGLAISYKEKTTSLAMMDRQRLLENIETMHAIEATTRGARLRRLVERRLSIAQRHLEHWDRTREQLESIAHQLATITELIQFLHAQSMAASSGPQEVSDEIDRFMAEFRENEGTLRELAEFGSDGL